MSKYNQQAIQLLLSLVVWFVALMPVTVKSQSLVKGIVFENDTTSPMYFVMVLNKTTGQGGMSGIDGMFEIVAQPDDTLIFSYVGYVRLKMKAKHYTRNRYGLISVIMQPVSYNLRPVVIQSFQLKDYERDYMNDIIDKSKMKPINVIQSPITALYMAYSKEGRQIRKLAEIFNKLLIEEAVEKKLNKQILTNLTGDENIDLEAFRKYCYYLTDDYIANHDGVELYNKIIDCYKSYQKEMRPRTLKTD